MIPKVDVLPSPKTILGESPLWYGPEQRLFFCDIRDHSVYDLDLETSDGHRWKFDEPVGSIALCRTGRLLLAMQTGLYAFDRASGGLSRVANPESDLPDNRFNDGRCDARGRFFVGTMQDFGGKQATGALYRIDPDFSYVPLLTDVRIPNSICWSPDACTMYFSDTPTGQLQAFDFDSDRGRMSNPRVLLDKGVLPGKCDGAAVDAEGCIWIARFGGGCVARITPDGAVDQVIEVPVTNVTSCCFAGTRLDTLIITTGTHGLAPEDLNQQPLAGRLFSVIPGVTGTPEAMFADTAAA